MADSILTERQIALLKLLAKERSFARDFYLTGGTALAAFYLQHRYSEDLDFFAEEEFDITQLSIFLRSHKKDFGILNIDFHQSYNRNMFFLHFDKEIVKTEFTYFPFARIEKGMKKYGIQVDSLLDIAVNKLFSVYQRTQARDYIDLYMICRDTDFSLGDLQKKARIKFDWHIDPLELGSQFAKAKDAKDYPRMIKKLDHKEWKTFFVEEAKKLKKEIFE